MANRLARNLIQASPQSEEPSGFFVLGDFLPLLILYSFASRFWIQACLYNIYQQIQKDD